MEALFAAGVVAVMIWAVVAGRAARQRRRDTLHQVAAVLGGGVDDRAARASGTLHGVGASVQFATRGSGSSAESWTYLDADLPPGYPLLLALRRHGFFDTGRISRGELVDVTFADPPFDDAFVVEGAPAEVVRRLLGPADRAFLLGHGTVELTTEPDGRLRLAIRNWLQDRDAALAALETVVRIARALREVSAALDRDIALAQTDSPYRPVLDDQPLQGARAARAAEVAALTTSRDARIARQRLMFIAGVVLFIVVAIALSARG